MASRLFSTLTLYAFFAAEAFAQTGGVGGSVKPKVVPEFDGAASMAVIALVLCGVAILRGRSR